MYVSPEDTLSANLSAAAAGIPPNAPSRFSLPVLRRKIHAQTCRCPLLQQCLSAKRLSENVLRMLQVLKMST